MPIVELADIADPRLDVYRDLNRSNLTVGSGRFIAESRLLVERLLASSFRTESVLASVQFRDELATLVPADVPIYLLPKDRISAVIGFDFHRGMLACGFRKHNPTLRELVPAIHDFDAANADTPNAPRLTVVVCPHIVDPTNLAGVIRNACAFGADALLLGPHCADPFSRRVVRVSMGTAFQLPIRVAQDMHTDLQELRDTLACERVATVLDPTATHLKAAAHPGRLALLFGCEGHGLDDATLARCDQRVTLPMHRGTDSLNLATSTGIFLFHYLS